MSLVKWKSSFAYYNIKHSTGIPHNLTGQAIIERTNQTLNDMLNKKKGLINNPPETVCIVLY